MNESIKIKGIYNKIAKPYAYDSNVSEHIDDFLKLLPENGIILESGCGAGIDSNYMNSKGFNITGIDLSEEMINIAKNKFPIIDFRVANFMDIEFESNFFNGIVFLYSLIHISKKDIKQILIKFYKFLKKDGIIYIALQSGKSEEVFIDALYNPEEKMFLNVFSYNEIRELLLDIGFSIIKKYERKPKTGELKYSKLHILARK